MARRRRAKPKPWPTYELPVAGNMTVHYGEFEDPHGGAHGPAGGYTDVETGNVYLRTPDDFATGHEAFHLLDKLATDRDRARWQRILGYKGEWDQGTGASAAGLRSPSELIADNFGMLASGRDPRTTMDGGYVESYNPKRLRRFGRSLERFRVRNGLEVYDRKTIRRRALKELGG